MLKQDVKRTLKKVIKGVAYSPLPFLFARLIRRIGAPVVYYHNPSPQLFGAHLIYFLQQGYRPLSLDALAADNGSAGARPLPPGALFITVDDGYRQNLELLKVIERHQVPVAFFVTAGFIGTRRRFWWDVVLEAGGSPRDFKQMSPLEMREVLLERYGYELTRDYPEPTALSWDELRLLASSPWVTIGSHTVNHPILPFCPLETAREEIVESKRLLETQLQRPVIHFAYPNGDCTNRERALVKEAGYVSARTTVGGLARLGRSDPFAIPTLCGLDQTQPVDLPMAMSGYPPVAERVKKWTRR